MVDQFRYREKIPAAVRAPDGILADAKTLIDARKITAAGDATKIEDASARKYVVAIIFEALRERLNGALTGLIGEHLDLIGEETALISGEGAAPELEALLEAFAGETIEALGGEAQGEAAFVAWATGDGTPEGLAKAMLDHPIVDEENALRHLQIDEEAVRELMDRARGITPVTTSWTLDDLIQIARENLTAGADILEVSESIEKILAYAAGWEDEVRKLLAGSPPLAEACIAYIATLDPEPDNLAAEHVMLQATQEPVLVLTGAEGNLPAGDIQELEFAGSVTPGRAALLALQKYAAIGDRELSERLGISRSKLNNYRGGKTEWEPSEDQNKTLIDVFNDHIVGLQSALFTFRGMD